MKQFRLFILLCLLASPALSQNDLHGDSLASDFRYLVKLLEATHPDPYSGFGGKVFFHEAAFRVENELRRTSGSRQSFFDQASTFLSHLQDGHTYLFAPPADPKEGQRQLPLQIRTIPNDIILQSVPHEYKHLLGSRLTGVNGCDMKAILAHTAAIHASENLYDCYANLCRHINREHFLQQILPDITDSVRLSLITPEGENTEITLPLLSRQEIENIKLQHTGSWPAYSDKQLEYHFADTKKQVMIININSIMARDNFEYMQKQGLKDLYRQLEFYYQNILKKEMPADTLQAVRELPSFAETFDKMLREMKKENSSTLIIDLRNNSGGWTPITDATLYQLFGDRFLQMDMGMRFYRLISPLYMQKIQTDLQSFNRQRGTNYAFGDYTFSVDAPDTTDVEKKRADFIRYCMCSVPEKLKELHGKPLYTPEHIYVVTNDRTFSAAFHYTFYLWRMGATIVGIPSGQAPNTYMEQTLFRLPHTRMEGSISNSMQVCLPTNDPRAKTLYPDLMPDYEDYRKYNFDNHTEVLYLLDRIKGR